MARKTTVNYNYNTRNGVGFWRLMFHLFMTLITGGLWLVGLAIYFFLKR